MLMHWTKLRSWAAKGAYPYEVKLRPRVMPKGSKGGDLDMVLEWCIQQFGRPANDYVDEGFPGTHKVYQERSWIWSMEGSGYLCFENSKDAVLAKLAWG